MAIVYKDVLKKLKDKGYSTYKLREENLISEGVIQKIRENKYISLQSIETICLLLNCQPSEIIKYVPEKE